MTGEKDDRLPMNIDEMITRVRTNLAMKIYVSVGLCMLFGVIYFLPQRFPVFPAITLKHTWLDRLIPFKPGAIYLYESICLFMPIAPWLMKSKLRLKQYFLGFLLMDLIGAAFFIFFPTAVPRPHATQTTNALYGFVVWMDADLNAFPSLHVAYSLFHLAWCQVIFNASKYRVLRYLFWVWALSIILSTLLVKQHVVIDCLGGSVLGLGCFFIGRRYLRSRLTPEGRRKGTD